LRFRFGSNGPAEGDLEAEGAELAHVVGYLPADPGLPVVVVRAEVLIAHAGAGQQLVVDPQLGVPDRDLGFGFAAAAGQPSAAGAFAGLGASGGDGGLASDGAGVPVALRTVLVLADAGPELRNNVPTPHNCGAFHVLEGCGE
jgi:hypothetical protein